MTHRTFALATAALLTLSALLVPVVSIATSSEEGGASADEGASSPAPCTVEDRPRAGLLGLEDRLGRSSAALHPAPSYAGGRATGGMAIWHPDRILEAGAPLNAVVAGDFLTERSGNETLTADASGRLWLAWREDYTWRSQVAWSAGGNLTSLAEGEFDGASAGREAAVSVAFANGTGAVVVLSGFGGQAAATQVLASLSPMRAVAAGDVHPGSPGAELVALDGGGNVSVAFPNSPAGSPQNVIRILGAACLLAADLDSSLSGEEVAVGTSSGEVFELFWDGSAWQERGLWVSASGVACLAFGDADPLHDGPELVLAAQNGDITILERLGDTWSGRAVGSPGGRVLALTVGDADADLPGNELIVGCPDNVTRIRWDGNAWDRARLWDGSGACNGLAVAEVDADHSGSEVLAAGQSGNLTALGLYHPGFSMSAKNGFLVLTGGETASFKLAFTPFDKLGGNLTLTVGALPAGIAVSTGAGPVALASPNVSAALNLTVGAAAANGEYRFLVTASHQAGIFDSVWLTLVLDRRLDMRISMGSREQNSAPGTTASYTVTVSNTGTVNDSYRIEARVEGGWKVKLSAGNLTGIMAPGENRSLELKVGVPGDAAGRTAKLTVNATSLAQPNLTRSASMKVVVPQKSAPCGLFILPAGLVGTAFMLGRKGNKREEK